MATELQSRHQSCEILCLAFHCAHGIREFEDLLQKCDCRRDVKVISCSKPHWTFCYKSNVSRKLNFSAHLHKLVLTWFPLVYKNGAIAFRHQSLELYCLQLKFTACHSVVLLVFLFHWRLFSPVNPNLLGELCLVTE
jgi:hypothetical protein